MSVVTGYPSQEKEDRADFVPSTVQWVDQFRHALDVIANSFASLVANDTVEASSTTTTINATGHSANIGDVIRFTSGNLNTIEAIVKSTETNSFTLCQKLSEAPATSDAFSILRRTTPVVTSSGGLSVSSAAPSSVTSGTKSVTTAGTRETLVASSTPCSKVILMHDETNTGTKGYWGGSTVDSSNGITCFKGAVLTIEIDDAQKIYVDVDTNGDSFKYNILA